MAGGGGADGVSLHGFGRWQIISKIKQVEQMTSPIGELPSACFPERAPTAGREVFAVMQISCERATPKVPVQIIRRRLAGRIRAPWVSKVISTLDSAGPDIGFDRFAKLIFAEHLHRFHPARDAGPLISHLRDQLGTRFQAFLDHSQFIQLMHQRFLAVDVFAMFHRGEHRRGMMEIRNVDNHGVELVGFVGEGFAIIAQLERAGMFRRDFLQFISIDIAETDKLRLLIAFQLLPLEAANPANANLENLEFAVLIRFGTAGERKRGDARGKHCAILQERAASNGRKIRSILVWLHKWEDMRNGNRGKEKRRGKFEHEITERTEEESRRRSSSSIVRVWPRVRSMALEAEKYDLAQNGQFNTTHWSVVVMAGTKGLPQTAEALEKLCRAYWFPLYAYVRRQGNTPEDAEDLTQQFFARLLEKNYLALADRERGKFRTFLLGSMKNFLVNEWKHAGRLKRGGDQSFVSFDAQVAEERYAAEPRAEPDPSPETIYEKQWAVALVEQVFAALRREYGAINKAALFEELKSFIWGDKASASYAEIGSRLKLTEGAVKVAVHRLRGRFRELLRAEVAHTVLSPEDIDGELRHLIAVLG
jgi:RNA polymerase sigma factor (sigma-70 family)